MTSLSPPGTPSSDRPGCAMCATHSRPQDVPWHQHAVGCVVRSLALASVAVRSVASR